MLNIEHENACLTYRKDMACKQNECDGTKFNQCHPISLSI